jgi:hypothetical protein
MDVVHLRLLRGVAAILTDVHLRIITRGEEQNKDDFKGRRYSNLLLIKTGPDQGSMQGWAKFVLIALERYSVELKRLTFNFR